MPRPRREVAALDILALDSGTRLGPYEILAPAGAGGMGEVYRARDTRLERLVAIKVVAAESASPVALERFEREAKAIAALSHPGICAIYDVGTTPVPFLVMELLEGETLHQRLQRGPFEFPPLIETGLALADALATAHARGVIHRDLKPANIILTPRGPKIVDFGLARVTETVATPELGATTYPTRLENAPLTDAGVAIGTVSYMSPEQLRGDTLDGRTDLFSLGLVLYEMTTGRRAFAGATTAVTSAAILHENPVPPRERRPDTPVKLEHAILRLLEKDREIRTQAAAEVRAELTRVKREHIVTGAETAMPSAISVGNVQTALSSADRSVALPSTSDAQLIAGVIRRHRRMAVAAAVALILLIFGIVYHASRWTSDARPAETGALTLGDLQVTPLTASGTADFPAITPNGDYVVYIERGVSGDSLRLRQVATESTGEIVPPARGTFLRGATVTPDGVFVNYVKQSGNQPAELWQVPLLGGTQRRLLRAGLVTFSPNGNEMAYVRPVGDQRTELVVAARDGSNERVLSSRELPERYWPAGPNASLAPAWSPDGTSIAVLGGTSAGVVAGGQFVLVDVRNGSERAFVGGEAPFIGSGLAWLDSTRLLVSMVDRASAPLQLWVFSVPDKKFTRLSNDVSQYVGVSTTADRNAFVTALTQTSFSILTSDSSGVTWAEAVRSRPVKGALGFGVRWIGDDLAYVSSSSGGFALLRWRSALKTEEILAPSGGNFSVSRNGSTIVYFDYDRREFGMIDSHGSRRLLLPGSSLDSQVQPDGRQVLTVEGGVGKPSRIILASLDGSESIREVTADRVRFAPAIAGGRTETSPDELRLAYPSWDENKQPVIAVCDLPACSGRRILPARALWRWRPDSKAIVYVDETTRSDLWVQPLDGSASQRLTQFPPDGREIWDFDWSADGQRIAVARASISANIVLYRGLQTRK